MKNYLLISSLTIVIFGCSFFDSKAKFEGNWKPEEVKENVVIKITKINDTSFDVKFYENGNLVNGEAVEMNGNYLLSKDGKSISKPVNIDYSNPAEAANRVGKSYTIQFTEDERLYFGNKFLVRIEN